MPLSSFKCFNDRGSFDMIKLFIVVIQEKALCSDKEKKDLPDVEVCVADQGSDEELKYDPTDSDY